MRTMPGRVEYISESHEAFYIRRPTPLLRRTNVGSNSLHLIYLINVGSGAPYRILP